MKKRKIFILSILGISIFCNAQKLVVLDNFYNNEFVAKTGKPFHYLWNDTTMSGFSQLGALFVQKGAVLATLNESPTLQNLSKAAVYIIVDPDNELETAHPNFMDKTAANNIAAWVKRGGVLLLLTNDAKHAELEKFNLLPAKFGISFGMEMLHPEKSEAGKPRNFNSCASVNLPNHPLFKGVSKIFLKEIAPIFCSKPAKPILVENGQAIMAEAKYGKGYVMAVGDPWLYNEYIDHLLLPTDFENKNTAANLVDLLLKQSR